jgi:lactoylglutathione lyase
MSTVMKEPSVFPHRILHTMLRVTDLEKSENFYCQILGMSILRKKEYPDGEFTLTFLGYAEESAHTVLELTYNWSDNSYSKGNGYGHIALAVNDIYATCLQLTEKGVEITRQPGPMKTDALEVIAFIKDPDGYQIELIERN